MSRFVLYRILGNDLPPRHRAGQTLSNLAFVLRHEPALADCEKRWVVNRIVDPRAEERILTLLRKRGCAFVHIPFVEEEYAACRMNFERLPEAQYFFGRKFRSLSLPWKLRIIEWCYRARHRYLTNNNGARNAALAEGRKLADWVLPFDGNCYFTAPAWDEVRRGAAAAGDRKYLVVPLVRVASNRELLDPGFRPEVKEEPQIVFHRDARETFDERLRYGSMDKAALLYRLDVPGIWKLHGPAFPAWEDLDLSPSPDAGGFVEAGWVARLFSGMDQLEREHGQRDNVRMQSILRIGDRVDARIVRRSFNRAQLCYFAEAEVDALRDGKAGARGWRGRFDAHADRVLRSGFSRRAGWARFAADFTTLVLAGHARGGDRCTQRAVEQLRVQWLDPDSRRSPRSDLEDGADDGAWIMELSGLVPALDALRLLERAGVLDPAELDGLQQWFKAFLAWLKTDRRARQVSRRPDHAGTAFDLVAVAAALYVNDVVYARRCLDAATMRIALQFRPDGGPVLETARRDRLLNLGLWSQLARLATAVQVDLKAFRTPEGRGLEAAATALAATMKSRSSLPIGDRCRLDAVLALAGSGEEFDAVACFMRTVADGGS